MAGPRVDFEFRALEQATGIGGTFAPKAIAEKHRIQTGKGYIPAVYVAAFLFGFVRDGASFADFERFNAAE